MNLARRHVSGPALLINPYGQRRLCLGFWSQRFYPYPFGPGPDACRNGTFFVGQAMALHVGGPGQEGFSAVQCRDQESSVSRLQSPHLAVAIACTLGLGSAVRALHGSTPRLSTAAGEERRSCRRYAGSPRPCAGPAFLFGFAAGARRPGRPGPGAKHSLRLLRAALPRSPSLVATRR